MYSFGAKFQLSFANYPELGVKKLKPKLEPEYIKYTYLGEQILA